MTWLLGASRGGPGEPAQRCRRKQGQESGGDDVAPSPPRVPSGPGGALDGWATRESPRGDRERRVDARGRHEHTRRAARVDATRDARANASCRGRKSTRGSSGTRALFGINGAPRRATRVARVGAHFRVTHLRTKQAYVQCSDRSDRHRLLESARILSPKWAKEPNEQCVLATA